MSINNGPWKNNMNQEYLYRPFSSHILVLGSQINVEIFGDGATLREISFPLIFRGGQSLSSRTDT